MTNEHKLLWLVKLCSLFHKISVIHESVALKLDIKIFEF